MEHTAQSIADELFSQIEKRLPPRPLVGGGFHHFVIRASVSAEVSPVVAFEALEALLIRLAEDCPEWGIEAEGSLSDLHVTFSR